MGEVSFCFGHLVVTFWIIILILAFLPGKVGEVGVSGAGNEGAAQSFKLSHPGSNVSDVSNISTILSQMSRVFQIFLPSCVRYLKYFLPVIESNNLCWTDKGEVQGVEEENHILPNIVGEADLNQNLSEKITRQI